MFFTRHSNKIGNSIVILNPIKVMNMPPHWKQFIISLLPYKYVFRNISRLACPRMVGAFYPYIPHMVISATLPRIMSFAHSVFPMATSTSCRLTSYYCSAVFATIGSHIIVPCSRFLHSFLSSVGTILPFGRMVISSLNCQSMFFSTRWTKLFEWRVTRKCHSTILTNSSKHCTSIIYYPDNFVNRRLPQC